MENCPFCNINREILACSDLCLAIYDMYPVNKGHVLVIPKRHVGDYFELSEAEVEDVWKVMKIIKN